MSHLVALRDFQFTASCYVASVVLLYCTVAAFAAAAADTH